MCFSFSRIWDDDEHFFRYSNCRDIYATLRVRCDFNPPVATKEGSTERRILLLQPEKLTLDSTHAFFRTAVEIYFFSAAMTLFGPRFRSAV